MLTLVISHFSQFSSVQFSCSVVSNSLRLHESQHARPPCPSPTPGAYSNTGPSSRYKMVKILLLSAAAAAAAKSLQSLQSCPTLCEPIDGSRPGSPVPEILQARTLEWAAVSFSNALQRKVKVKSLSRVRFFAIPWTAASQAPPSLGFSRKEYWSGLPLPSPVLLSTLVNNTI